MDVTKTEKITSIENNKYIHFKIDYRSNKIFISFLKKKSEIPKNSIVFLNKLEKEKKGLFEYILLDGNTENKKFIKLVEKDLFNN